MKPAFLTAMASMLMVACIEAETKAPMAPATDAPVAGAAQTLTSILWLDSVKNMGTILEGQKLEVVFRFRNTGSYPLVIESATPSCGCTVPSKPEKPVMSGEEGEIKAVFDSQGRTGTNHKSIAVQANTDGNPTHQLVFDVQVVGKTEGPKPADPSPQKF
jgi:hypothetical protein